jgi:hypothetical protein
MISSRKQSAKQTPPKLVFHYAPAAYLDAILESGELRPSNAGAPNEKPLLWFSARQDWEPTSTKSVWINGRLRHLTFEEQALTKGCIRFGLPRADPRLMDWKRSCAFGGTKASIRRAMEQYGKRLGAQPSDWFSVPEPILLSELRFEVLLDWKWHLEDPYEMDQFWRDVSALKRG